MAESRSASRRRWSREALPQGAHDETAQTMAEYAVILTVITVGILAALVLLGTNIPARISDVANLIPIP